MNVFGSSELQKKWQNPESKVVWVDQIMHFLPGLQSALQATSASEEQGWPVLVFAGQNQGHLPQNDPCH